MKKFLIADVIPMTFAIAGVLVLMHLWLSADAAVGLQERLPGGDNKPANAGAGDEPVKIAGTLTQSDGVPADLPGACQAALSYACPVYGRILQGEL